MIISNSEKNLPFKWISKTREGAVPLGDQHLGDVLAGGCV